MSKSTHLRLATSFVGFSLCLLIPSTDTVQKYFGKRGVAAYLLVGFCMLFISYRVMIRWLIPLMTEKRVLWLSLSTLFCLVLLFLILYPRAQSGIVSGGSDADDALNLAATELIHGRYPYYPKTYLGNPIAPLPGAVILAVPFVLLGNSAYQNIFWLAAFFLAARFFLKNSALALALLWLILAFSPSVLQNIVTGGDHLANTIYILLFMRWMVIFIPRNNVTTVKKLLPSILLGIGLSSRSNFILVMPLLFSTLVQTAGWRSAIKHIAVTCLFLGAITIPFWLYDPQAFSPLFQQSNKVAQYRTLLPLAGILIPLTAVAISLALSFQRMDSDCVVLFRNCAIVQAFPVLCVMILSTIQAGDLDLVRAGYGLFFLFFGALALWKVLSESERRL